MKILPPNTIGISKKKCLATILLILCCFPLFIDRVLATEYTITQLTNNNYGDYSPQINNGQVVWYGYDGSSYNIFFYDGNRTIQLTDNGYALGPQIDNGQIVWYGYDGNDYEIFLYDGVRTIQLTNNKYDDISPKINNGQVTWQEHDGNDYEIFLYDGSRTIQLTDDDYNDWSPQIHKGEVVWYGRSWSGTTYEIFFYDGTLTIQLTGSNYDDLNPQIDNGQIVWHGGRYGYFEIFLYDGIKTIKLTNNDYNDVYPQIHSGQVIWYAYVNKNYRPEVFLYNGMQTIRLTNNNYSDSDSRIHNGQAVWTADRGDSEVFLYDGTQVTQLTNNAYSDYSPQINNGQVVWYGYDGNDYEIFLATPRSVEPTLEILDGADFSAGREISNDPEKLSSGGTSVTGAVTDGVTRLLLRLPLNKLNEVTFSLEGGTGNPTEDGVLRSIDGLQEGQAITVTTATTTIGETALAIYQAPENFVRQGHPEDKQISERKISVKIKSNRSPDFEFSKEIKLVRPPVILIHGLWSGPEMWDDFSNRLRNILPGIRIFTVNYRDTNASSFDVNKDEVRDNIYEIRKELRSQGIAMVQADVLGHSMGGLLSRIYAAGDGLYYKGYYANDKNFLMGNINELITLDSPHFGSFLADFAIEYIDVLGRVNPEERDKLLEYARDKGFPLDEGAIEDMMTLSPKIISLNSISTDPPSHAIIGDFGLEFRLRIVMLGSSGEFFEVVLEAGAGTDVGPSDLVVSTKSQAGGLTPPASSTFEHHHLNATGEDVVNKTAELFNTVPDDSLFEVGFPIDKWPE